MITDSFDLTTEAVVRPQSFAQPVAGFPEVAVITFRQEIADLIPTRFGGEVIHTLHAGFRIPVYKIQYKGVAVAVYQTLIGAASTVALAEEVHSLGAKRFVVFGSCGVLDRALTAGRLIVPTAAYRDEGISYHYAPAADWIDVPTAARLGEILDALHLPYITGKTWTTDGLYRETRKNVALRRAEGCITVEMECAALAAAAGLCGFEVYQYLYAEDNLDCETWERRTMGNVPMDTKERYLRIALDVAKQV
ncbi:MAG: nucleoside phosphorylase [Oscillospiraceae bacterium]|jgi:uridine phosphorylase|nr:nucleoside phosphorylase [Oscillospiraceae bacterium]